MIKINVKKELGIAKSFELKESNKNVRMAWLLNKKLAKMSLMQEAHAETPEAMDKQLDTILDMQKTVIDYIVTALKLTDAQAEKIDEDLSFDDTISVAVKISSAILHIEAKPTEGDAGLQAEEN